MVLLSVVASALAVGLIARVVEVVHDAKCQAAALVAGLLLVLSPTFAAQAVVVEAYGPAAAVQAGLLLAALTARPQVVGLLYGLALAAHPGSVFLLPLLVFGILRAPERRPAVWTGLGGLVAGLATFLYVPLAAWRAGSRVDVLNWGGIQDTASLLSHLLRTQFGGGPPRDLVTQAGFVAEHLIGQWPLVIGVALVFGIVWKRRGNAGAPGGPVDVAASLFGFTLFLTSLGLFWAQHWPVAEEIARVRLAGSFTPMVVVCAALLGVLLGRVELRWGTKPKPILAGLLLLGGTIHISPYGRTTLAEFRDMSEVTQATDYANAVLGDLPEGALIVINHLGYGDVLYFPLLYAQLARAVRPDVLVINRELLGAPWYRRQLETARPGLVPALARLNEQLIRVAQSANRGPRENRDAQEPFLRELATNPSLAPGGLGFIGKPSARIQGDLPLWAGSDCWWLGSQPPPPNRKAAAGISSPRAPPTPGAANCASSPTPVANSHPGTRAVAANSPIR